MDLDMRRLEDVIHETVWEYLIRNIGDLPGDLVLNVWLRDDGLWELNLCLGNGSVWRCLAGDMNDILDELSESIDAIRERLWHLGTLLLAGKHGA